jgi:hypothetical protein
LGEQDRSKIAISPNDHVVEIYNYRDGQFTLEATLNEHGQRVTGIDWCGTLPVFFLPSL